MRFGSRPNKHLGFASRGIGLLQVIAVLALVALSWWAWSRSRAARSTNPTVEMPPLPPMAESRMSPNPSPVRDDSTAVGSGGSGVAPVLPQATSLPAPTNVSPVIETNQSRVLLVRTNADGSISIPNWISEPTNRVPYGSHAARSVLDAQVGLARRGISPGPIDGVMGGQTRLAIRAFQNQLGIADTGELDAYTRRALWVREDPITTYVIQTNDIAELSPVPATWLGKSQAARLGYESLIEVVAEKGWAYESFIQRLNPDIDWANVLPGQVVNLPRVRYPEFNVKAAYIRIRLGERNLQAFDENDRLMVHFPCSIGQRVDKRPVGELSVATVAPDPVYTFDPEIFTESEEGRSLGRKLIIPPGPNNPVGVVWIGLSRDGYGIHGTPKPEEVGRTESHGCFRLANWNARILMRLCWVGMPVFVEP